MNAATQHLDDGVSLQEAAQALIDAQQKPASRNAVAAGVAAKSLIAKTIKSLARKNERAQTMTMREYLAGMQQIPRLAYARPDATRFAMPQDMNMSTLRLASGMLSSRFLNFDNRALFDESVSLMREMLLITYEAKPRPISYGITGYRMSDFIAYIYQDILMDDMKMSDHQRGRPFESRVEALKMWMMMPTGKSAVNSARRHIRRRLMVLLDRTNHQAAALFEDREVPSELIHLIHKLMERDDDLGYTEGRVRPYREVRADFNALAEFCVRNRFKHDSERLRTLDRLVCPSLITDFPGYPIDLPRGRVARTTPQEILDRYVDDSGRTSGANSIDREREEFLLRTAKETVKRMADKAKKGDKSGKVKAAKPTSGVPRMAKKRVAKPEVAAPVATGAVAQKADQPVSGLDALSALEKLL